MKSVTNELAASFINTFWDDFQKISNYMTLNVRFLLSHDDNYKQTMGYFNVKPVTPRNRAPSVVLRGVTLQLSKCCVLQF